MKGKIYTQRSKLLSYEGYNIATYLARIAPLVSHKQGTQSDQQKI
jgi:hypothetical protein